MKKYSLFLITILMIVLTSCCQEIEKNDLDEYNQYISKSGIGYSDFELDHPDYLLPYSTFLSDYKYIVGNFNFYERNSFCDLYESKCKPNRVFISLKYTEEVYHLAKENVLNKIPVYDHKYYYYGNYNFYVNKNFMDKFDEQHRPMIPNWFTMVCYNDINYTIIFLGFYNSYPKLDDRYLLDLDNNWSSFIIQYFGEYYNFHE